MRSPILFVRHLLVVPALLCLLLTLSVKKSIAQYDMDYISYNDFYQHLAGYGQWIEDLEYGYVWSPNEDVNFRPYYTNGHWLMTEYGNTWVSDYPWGWACFHYGRWTFDDYYGWLWIPGGQWGPAWVSWRNGDGFYGWAPLGPTGDLGAITNYKCPSSWWVFIPSRYIYSGSYYRFWYGSKDNKKMVKSSTVIPNTFVKGNTTYITGPHIAQVKQVMGGPVQIYKVRNSRNHNTRVHTDEIRMYRPEEIPKVARLGEKAPPPNLMAAPKPVRQPQPVPVAYGAMPPFRETVITRNNAAQSVPGTNINQTAEPPPVPRNSSNPYEWDVTRSVKQDEAPPRPPKPKPAAKPTKPLVKPYRPVRAQQAPVQQRPSPTR